VVRIAVRPSFSLVGVAQDYFSRAAWRISNDLHLAPSFDIENARRDFCSLASHDTQHRAAIEVLYRERGSRRASTHQDIKFQDPFGNF
jgi:hypothetical protein